MAKKNTSKKADPVLTKEEQIKKSLENDMSEIMRHFHLVPEPTYRFDVGDRVIIGALEDVYIEEVLENGKVYKIDYAHTNHNYGNPIKHEHMKQYVVWHRVRKFQESASMELIKNRDLRLSYAQERLSGLLTKVYSFGVDFSPEYQRDYVWDLEDKVSLIDSIFNSVDIGKFAFIFKGYGEGYMFEILDGKQRLRAITDFYEDRYQYKGKYFSDLSIREQDFFEEYSVSVAEAEELTEEQKLRYFLKLNKAGKVMDREHLEKVEKMLEKIEKAEDEK